MTIIDRYLFRRLAAALAKALLALVALYVLVDLLTHRDDAILRYDVAWPVVARYYLDLVPQVVYRVAPLALLVSALLVLGDSAQHNEITSALAGGISLRRFCRAPVVLALAFAAGLFVMEETVGVRATQRAIRVENTYFLQKLDTGRGGISWANLSGDWTCHMAKFNRLALTGENVFIHSIRKDAIEQIEARRIFWDETQGKWFLEDGVWMVFDAGVTTRSATRITQCPAPFSETPQELFALTAPPETKTVRQLAADIAAASARGMPVKRAWVDFHAKFAQPALCFVMVGLAIPFAVRLRRGGLAVSFGASIVIAIVYLVLFNVCMTLGHAERLSPVVAAWLPNAVFLGGGVGLFLKTPT